MQTFEVKIATLDRVPRLRLTLDWLPQGRAPNTVYTRTTLVMGGREWDMAGCLIVDLIRELRELRAADEAERETHVPE